MHMYMTVSCTVILSVNVRVRRFVVVVVVGRSREGRQREMSSDEEETKEEEEERKPKSPEPVTPNEQPETSTIRACELLLIKKHENPFCYIYTVEHTEYMEKLHNFTLDHHSLYPYVIFCYIQRLQLIILWM